MPTRDGTFQVMLPESSAAASLFSFHCFSPITTSFFYT